MPVGLVPEGVTVASIDDYNDERGMVELEAILNS